VVSHPHHASPLSFMGLVLPACRQGYSSAFTYPHDAPLQAPFGSSFRQPAQVHEAVFPVMIPIFRAPFSQDLASLSGIPDQSNAVHNFIGDYGRQMWLIENARHVGKAWQAMERLRTQPPLVTTETVLSQGNLQR